MSKLRPRDTVVAGSNPVIANRISGVAIQFVIAKPEGLCISILLDRHGPSGLAMTATHVNDFRN